MPNTLTPLINDLHVAVKKNAITDTSVINAVTLNAGSEFASNNRTIRKVSVEDETIQTSHSPSMTLSEPDDTTILSDTMTLSKTVKASFGFEGEEEKDIADSAEGYETIYGTILERRIQGMVKQIEDDLIDTVYKGASRAVGTAGTTPFASNINALNDLESIFYQNDYMGDDLSFIGDLASFNNLRNLGNLQKVNEAGSDNTLRRGLIDPLSGFQIARNNRIGTHTKGTGTGYLVNNSGGYAIGATTLALDTGSGTIIAGDVITIGNYNYVVKTALTGGNVVISKPGLREAVANNATVTVNNNFVYNLGFARDAVELAIRPMAKPAGGDGAKMVELVQLGDTGITLTASFYGGEDKGKVSIVGVYNSKVWIPENVGILMG